MSRRSSPIFSTSSVSRTAISGPRASAIGRLRLPLEGEVNRPAAEKEREHRIGAEAGAVDDAERGMFAGRERDVQRLPEQRVVDLQAMRSRLHFARHLVAGVEDGDLLGVERDVDVAIADVLLRRPPYGDGGGPGLFQVRHHLADVLGGRFDRGYCAGGWHWAAR